VLTGLTSVINELGYACDHALTTVVAANLLAARRYDAVLIDIQIAGQERRRTRRRNTGRQGAESRDAAARHERAEVTARYEHGPFDACLTKPIDRNALISALRVAWPETWPSSTV
jgi:CheY-like chemotaxis protein